VREFKIQSGSAPDHIRAMIVGPTSSGKTTFAATAPRPLIISDATEGGWRTVQTMHPDLWWDPAVPPEIWVIEKAMASGKQQGDTVTILNRLEEAARVAASGGKPFPWRTIVFDPISLYTDRMIAEMQLNDPGKDTRQVYGDLANHLRVLILRVHALPAHVLWLCHTKNDGSLAMSGQMAEKFPAFCDFKWMTWANTIGVAQPVYELHTAPFRQWNFLGGRWPIPSPVLPSFKIISAYLNMPEQPVSTAVRGWNWPPAPPSPSPGP
jgi:hypothetical protein